MSEATAYDPLQALPSDLAIPRDERGPLFVEPWEARAFALVVDMNARGLFAWKEFQRLLIEEIHRGEAAGHCQPYYSSWLIAAERLFEAKGFSQRREIDSEVERLRPDDRTIHLR